ncbi:hypothetical protein LQL77_06970 [Rhodococcus cerastii]|nr:hypothetical protein [Rhodococcus cerastii]
MLPRFSQKDVRQFADQLVAHGFIYDGDDTKGHARFVFPGSSSSITLPETPRGQRWRQVKWNDAQQITGRRVDAKFDRAKAVSRRAREHRSLAALESRRDAERARLESLRTREAHESQLTSRIECRRQELREVSSLMGGYSSI